MVWIKDNITRTGKEVWYEAELIDAIKARCKNKIDLFKKEKSDYNFGVAIMANDILSKIASYEGER